MGKRGKRENKLRRREKSEMKGRLRSFVMFLPNMVMLMGRLLKDSRVPAAEKALFAAAIVYVISPLDLIPDLFPFIGHVDDLYVVALVLLRLVNRSDQSVVRRHWSGGGDIVALADSIVKIAPKFLPPRIARILTSRVELAPAGNILSSIANKDEPIVREIVGDENRSIETHSRSVN
jgi:uncharacterized membrane protein YkvA (DUF1232 family)